jgi:hypothetical protein
MSDETDTASTAYETLELTLDAIKEAYHRSSKIVSDKDIVDEIKCISDEDLILRTREGVNWLKQIYTTLPNNRKKLQRFIKKVLSVKQGEEYELKTIINKAKSVDLVLFAKIGILQSHLKSLSDQRTELKGTLDTAKDIESIPPPNAVELLNAADEVMDQYDEAIKSANQKCSRLLKAFSKIL